MPNRSCNDLYLQELISDPWDTESWILPLKVIRSRTQWPSSHESFLARMIQETQISRLSLEFWGTGTEELPSFNLSCYMFDLSISQVIFFYLWDWVSTCQDPILPSLQQKQQLLFLSSLLFPISSSRLPPAVHSLL